MLMINKHVIAPSLHRKIRMDHLSLDHDRALILIRHASEEHPVRDHHLRLRSDALTTYGHIHRSAFLERFPDIWFRHPFTHILIVAEYDRLDALTKFFRQLLIQFFRQIFRILVQHFRERRQFILGGFQDLFKIALLEELPDERSVGFFEIAVFRLIICMVIKGFSVLVSDIDPTFRHQLQFHLNILYCRSNQIVSVF